MDRDRRLSLTVGGFALIALAALVVAILSLSAQQGIFRARYGLVAYFDNVQGLVSGAAVRLAGTQVGQVESVDLSLRPGGEPAVKVKLQIDEGVQQRIRGNSVALITTVGLLGDQIVEISIGTSESEVLTDGAEIQTLDPFDLNVMVSKGGLALDAIESLASNLNATIDEFRQGAGGRKLAESLSGFSEIIGEVQEGEGTLHALIYEPYEGGAVESAESALESLDGILEEVEHGDGLLHSLVYDEPGEQDVLLQALQASARLNSILTKIDGGDGTLGLLLNDPTLYEELKILVGGAGRSTLVRSMIDMVTPDAK
jgi:phospholipid/cholesterol/gamma-HCH transport system substrate-binding protein